MKALAEVEIGFSASFARRACELRSCSGFAVSHTDLTDATARFGHIEEARRAWGRQLGKADGCRTGQYTASH
jgi:hypothetical protein